jgi:hypothetical protein
VRRESRSRARSCLANSSKLRQLVVRVATPQLLMLVRFDPSVFGLGLVGKLQVVALLIPATLSIHSTSSPFVRARLRFLLWPCAAALRLKASEACTSPFHRVSPWFSPLAIGSASSRWGTKHSAAPKGSIPVSRLKSKATSELALFEPPPSILCVIRLH